MFDQRKAEHFPSSISWLSTDLRILTKEPREHGPRFLPSTQVLLDPIVMTLPRRFMASLVLPLSLSYFPNHDLDLVLLLVLVVVLAILSKVSKLIDKDRQHARISSSTYY